LRKISLMGKRSRCLFLQALLKALVAHQLVGL